VESCLPDYWCALILWRGTVSSCFFLFVCVLVCFHLGVWKHRSSQMLTSMWHLRVNFYPFFSCSERNSKTEKKTRTFSFSSCLPSGSTSESIQEILVPGTSRQPHYLRNTTSKFPGNRNVRNQKLFTISYLSVRIDPELAFRPKREQHPHPSLTEWWWWGFFFSLVFI